MTLEGLDHRVAKETKTGAAAQVGVHEDPEVPGRSRLGVSFEVRVRQEARKPGEAQAGPTRGQLQPHVGRDHRDRAVGEWVSSMKARSRWSPHQPIRRRVPAMTAS